MVVFSQDGRPIAVAYRHITGAITNNDLTWTKHRPRCHPVSTFGCAGSGHSHDANCKNGPRQDDSKTVHVATTDCVQFINHEAIDLDISDDLFAQGGAVKHLWTCSSPGTF